MAEEPIIRGFDQRERVGESSRAVDYRAVQVSTHRSVRLRVLKPEYAAIPGEIDRFFQLARAVVKCRRHHFVEIYDVTRTENGCYLVMEDMAGETVQEWLDRVGRLDAATAVTVAVAVGKALGHAWSVARFIHGNIKPGVITFHADHGVYITDFSLAQLAPPGEDMVVPAGVVEGTPAYLSPERVTAGASVDFRSDMYSLGATLYHMVTGKQPFKGAAPADVLAQHRDGTLTNPCDEVADLPDGVAQVMARLMMKAPADRYETWADAVADLRKALSRRAGDTWSDQSTIAPPRILPGAAGTGRTSSGRVSATPSKSKKRRVVVRLSRPSAVAKSARGSGSTSSREVSAWIRLPAWILLLLGWIVLARLRWGLPLVSHDPGPGAEPDRAVPASPAVPPAASMAEPVIEEPEPSVPVGDVLPDAMAEQRTAWWDHLAAAIIAKRFTEAQAMIETQAGLADAWLTPGEIADLRAYLVDVSRMDAVMAEHFRERIGQRTTAQHEGREVGVELRALSGNRVSVLLIDEKTRQTQVQPVVLPASRIHVLERIRWLGPIDTSAKRTMKYILFMEAGDHAGARVWVSGPSPLAEALIRAAEGGHP